MTILFSRVFYNFVDALSDGILGLLRHLFFLVVKSLLHIALWWLFAGAEFHHCGIKSFALEITFPNFSRGACDAFSEFGFDLHTGSQCARVLWCCLFNFLFENLGTITASLANHLFC